MAKQARSPQQSCGLHQCHDAYRLTSGNLPDVILGFFKIFASQSRRKTGFKGQSTRTSFLLTIKPV
jgi:hypothetical protein